ncbi:MAG TPA: VOC family protein [Actinomycetota bacterium]|nr:VOC family protein [Actinomycetota bacterium]
MSDGTVLSLEHVTVTTPEELEEEVLGWYRDTLGLTRVDKPAEAQPGGGWFEVGGQQIHVLIDPHNPPKNAHFCIRVADFDAFVANLRTHNCHIEQARELPGRKRCFTRDPAGNSIEIVAFDGETP